MKKNLWIKITAVALSLAVLTLAGCSKEETKQEPETQAPEKIEVVHPLNTIYSSNFIRMDDISGWEEGVERLGYSDAEVIYQTENGNGYIVKVNAGSPNEELVNIYAFYEDEDAVYVDTVCEEAVFDKYELCEIDGDSATEEIAIHFGFIGSGANHEVQVWNFNYDMPNKLFSTESDFGYYSIPYEGYKIIIDNIYTGYQTIFNSEDNSANEFIFDENGTPIGGEGAMFMSGYETVIKDVDNDGRDELICKESVCLAFNANYIGSTVTTIDYDTNMGEFVVVDAEFVEATNDELV